MDSAEHFRHAEHQLAMCKDKDLGDMESFFVLGNAMTHAILALVAVLKEK